MNTLLQFSALLAIILLIPYSSALFAKEQNLASKIEKIAVHHVRTSSISKDLTQDNVLLVLADVSSQQRSVGDFASQLAGVELNGQGGLKQSYNIRGFSRARIKTEIDGIAIIGDRRAGNSASFLPPEFIANIYVQKGPSSTLYGSGAMGGVVSLSTINNSLSNVGISYQAQDNSKQIHGIFSNDELSLGLLYRKADNSLSANKTPLNSQLKQSTAILNYSTNWLNFDISASSILSKGVNLGKSSATFPTQRISLYPQDDHWLSQVKMSDNETWQLQFFHHQQAWQSQVTRLLNSGTSTDIKRRNVTDYQATTLGGVSRFQLNNFTLGVEWLGRRNIKISEQEFDENINAAWQNLSTHAKQDTYSAFIEHAWRFNRLTLNFGARYDAIQLQQKRLEDPKRRRDSFSSFALTTEYVIDPHHNVSAEIATAFRFPSVSELFFSGETPRGNTQGNIGLVPEESIGLQINYRFQFNEQVSMEANTYFYLVDNYIERFQLTEQVRSYRNSEQVRIKGGELALLWQVNNTLKSTVSYQWQQGQDHAKKTIDDGLPSAIKWSLNYQPSSEKLDKFSFNNQLNYRFDQSTFGSSEQALANVLVWHGSVKYSPNENIEVTLSVLNGTNKNYRASADEDAPWQPKRSILLKWQWFY